MAAGLLIFPGAYPSRAWNNADRIAAQIAFYENGAPGTPKTVYADVGLATPLGNPVHSDAYGNFPAIYADVAELYTAVWSTDDGQSKTYDDLSASTAANQSILDQTQEALDAALAIYGGMEAVEAAVEASQASATASEGSEAAAASSASAANQSKLDAAQLKSDTEVFKNAAAASAVSAATSETNAAASASRAGTMSNGFAFQFSTTTTDADPGNGRVRFNNATLASVTRLYVDNLDSTGATVSAWLDSFDDSTNTVRGILTIRSGTSMAVFAVNGAVVDGTGYRKVPVIYVGSSGTFANNADMGLSFSRAGDVAPAAALGYNPKTASDTVTALDWGKLIDCTSNDFTLSFNSAAALGAGFYCYVRAGTGTITGPTADGATVTWRPGDVGIISSDGANLHHLIMHRAGWRDVASPVTISGSPTTITITGWSSEITDLALNFDTVALNGSSNLNVAVSVSSDGSSFSGVVGVSTSAAPPYSGRVLLTDIRSTFGPIISTLGAAVGAAPGIALGSANTANRRTSGPITHVRFSVTGSGTLSFASGTITPRGR